MPFYSLLDSPINSFKGQIISVIGGGGKSSLLKKIGQELVKLNLKVILTTTTKIEPFPNTGLVLLKGRGQDIREELTYMLDEFKIVMVAKDRYKKDKLVGVDAEIVGKFKSMQILYASKQMGQGSVLLKQPCPTSRSFLQQRIK